MIWINPNSNPNLRKELGTEAIHLLLFLVRDIIAEIESVDSAHDEHEAHSASA
jgi:hypothetical protein